MGLFRKWLAENRTFDFAVRQGEIDSSGAYFSTPGSSTYFDPDSDHVEHYNISKCKIADTHEPQVAKALLQELLKDVRLNNEERQDIIDKLENPADPNYVYIDYLMNDGLPLPDAAKKLGYDGICVWENDDITEPSSVFIWNVNKVVKIPKTSAGLA